MAMLYVPPREALGAASALMRELPGVLRAHVGLQVAAGGKALLAESAGELLHVVVDHLAKREKKKSMRKKNRSLFTGDRVLLGAGQLETGP